MSQRISCFPFLLLQVTLLSFLAVPLLSHELYIIPNSFRVQPGQAITVRFHNGEEFPEAEGSMTPDRLANCKLVGADGSFELQNLRSEKGQRPAIGDVQVRGKGTLVLTATALPRVNEMDAAKFTKDFEEDGLDNALKYRAEHGESDKPARERTNKFAKALLVSGEPSDFSLRPLGLLLEILPEKDPGRLKPGEMLPIQVVYHGKPASGLQVEASWVGAGPTKVTVLGRTGKDGRIKVPLQKGKCRLAVKVAERYQDQAVANWEAFSATLTFESR